MSVSLGITWPGGRFEEVPIASLQATEAWGEDARELGLELMPYFSSFIPVEPTNLDQLLSELGIFRAEMVRRGPEYQQRAEVTDQLIDALRRLKRTQGWSASIG